MKTVMKGISICLALLLTVGLLTACDFYETIPAVEEIFGIFNDSTNCRIAVSISTDSSEGGMSVSMALDMAMEKDGDLLYVVTDRTLTFLGQTSTMRQEMYMKKAGEQFIAYSKDAETGKWSSSVEMSESDSGVSDYERLFRSEYYGEFDKKTRRYTMNEGTAVTIDGDSYTDAYIECRGGSYTLYANFDSEGMECVLEMRCSDIGKVSLTLPEAIEA